MKIVKINTQKHFHSKIWIDDKFQFCYVVQNNNSQFGFTKKVNVDIGSVLSCCNHSKTSISEVTGEH